MAGEELQGFSDPPGLTFGGFTIERLVVMLDPDVTDAWLGAELLADYVLEFDPARARVCIRGPTHVDGVRAIPMD